MKVYYCDGSQHKEFERLGIGITFGDFEYYHEITDFDYSKNLHEIEAIKRTVEFALKNKSGNEKITIVNDDKYLVERIQSIKNNLKIRTGKLKRKQEFKELIRLLKENDVVVRSPKNPYDRMQIGKCHRLSRSYIDNG